MGRFQQLRARERRADRRERDARDRPIGIRPRPTSSSRPNEHKLRQLASSGKEGADVMRFGIGQPVTRKEDPRFLTGRGRYVADIDLARQVYAVFLYSPHAHARIRGINTTAAARLPGVHAVLTGEDWAADGLGTLDPEMMVEDMGGPKGYRTKRPPLAQDRVRYVGERVAVVIAATEAQARDAAELVSVDYQVLPAAVR